MSNRNEPYMHPGCGACQETVIRGVRLATAYVPFQLFCGMGPPLMALSKGTAFPELYSPYHKREFAGLEPEICGMSDYGRCHPHER